VAVMAKEALLEYSAVWFVGDDAITGAEPDGGEQHTKPVLVMRWYPHTIPVC